MSDLPLTGEVSNSKLAATFGSESAARAAAAAVATEAGLEPAQIKLITPDEPDPGIKLEPEGRGIWRTIVVAHIWLGIAGVVVGALAFALLMWLDIPAIVNSPALAGSLLLFFGGVAGLLVGGLVALRPDHDRYVLATQEAMARDCTTVVVHALSADQATQAANILSRLGGNVTRTL